MKRSHGTPTAMAMGLLSALGATVHAADNPNKLRSEMAKAEQEYITLYNKLNTERQFDIVCRTDRPTGSSISVRTCQPRYMLRAVETAATERMQSAVSAAGSTGGANANGPDVGAASGGGVVSGPADKLQAFRQNVLDVQQQNSELMELGKKRDDLQKRFNEASKGGNSQ
ncbi:MAG: hypothetical protein ABIP38_01615 [Steroidobacteraceae bacterium]